MSTSAAGRERPVQPSIVGEHELGRRVMAGGLMASIIAITVGTVLDFTVTVGPDQHGFNIHGVGIILMVVGAVGVVISLFAFFAGSGPRRHRTTIDDGRGNVVRRDETYI